MEKNIKFYVDIDSYILCIDEKPIKIFFNDKTLDSQKLYDYIFSGVTKIIELKFDNQLDSSINDEKFSHLDDKDKRKIVSEGNFIYSKIKTLIEEENNTIPELTKSIK